MDRALPWRNRAACADSPLEFVFEDTTDGELRSPARVANLLEVCANCPVRRDCLLYALESTVRASTLGVWGGTVTTERLKALGRPTRDKERWASRIDRQQIVQVAEVLEASFPKRLALWRERATRPCDRCASPITRTPGARHCAPCRAALEQASKEWTRARNRAREAEKRLRRAEAPPGP
jgi:WhiB family redox-sensing transcriptional regulator